jgi:DNA-binding transcriptional ArsR family regulator
MLNQPQSVEVLRALGDEVRLGMVRAVVQQGHAVSSCDIVSSCSSLTKLSQPTISHHFHKLVDAGVLLETKDGVAKTYKVNRALLRSLGINITTLSTRT